MNVFWEEHAYILYVLVIAGFGYFIFTLKLALKNLEKWKDIRGIDMAQIKDKQGVLRESLPEKYVSFVTYKSDITEIKDILLRVAEKLDCKVDKSRSWDGNERRFN
jgi:hypothetical protein